MAETIKIEIPIEAVDKTEAGIQSATRNLTAFERSMTRTQNQLDRMNRSGVSIEIGADDNASPVLNGVEDSASRVSGMSADVSVGVDDNATQAIRSAEDSVENFDGQSGSADIGTEDNATPVVRAASDAVENFSGSSGSAEIGAEDNASPVIDSVRDKAAAWDGSVWNATVGIIDAATAPISALMSGLSNPLTQAGALLGVSVGLGDTINTYKGFESMMSQVSAISGATGADLDALTAKAKEMGATTKFTATESAEAFNFMAMAGWKTSDMISGIDGILNLAAASGENLGTTSDIVTDALTAFGLKANQAGHFADVMAQASSNANTNVSMLGESFKYVAPVAGAMNYSIEDTSLALGLMANASVKGSMAGTALKTAIANMASPTDTMATAMEKYGISLTDSEGNMKSLGDVLKNLRSGLGGLSETEQTAAASAIFGKEAMAGMLAIINASEDDYNKLAAAVYNADGAAQHMADTMLDNLEGSLTLMGSAVDGVKNAFGERLAPYIAGVADMITEAMPGAEAALTGLMDFVDGKAAGVKRSIDSMMASDEWQKADLFGKVNIAWDKLVAEPFTKWAGTKGKNLLSKGLSSLFSEAGKILPGGEDAGLMSWLSAGVIAKGATSLIGGARGIVEALTPIGGAISNIASAAANAGSVGGFFSSVGSMIPMGGKIALAAAAITGAVAAIGVAIDNYNQKQLSNSLEEHFGNIQLSAKEAEEAASGILNAKYLVNIDLAMNAITGADEMREKAQEALDANEVLTWKSSVGIELSPDEQQEYKDNISTFVESKISELEQRTFAAHLNVQTFLGNTEEGSTLAASIEEWARADTIELTALSNDLQSAVETALQDGIINVDEAQAVAALQDKMNSITSRWKEAEAQAQMDWINQEYGSLSGKELTSESFTAVVEALAGQRQAAAEKTEAEAKEFYAQLNAAEAAGRITGSQSDSYKSMAGEAIRNQRAADLMNSLNFETNTLNDTYGSKVQDSSQKVQEAASRAVQMAQQEMASDMMGRWALSMGTEAEILSAGNGKGLFDITTDRDQNALNDRWQVMKPDADAMASLMDEYAEVGQKVPKQLMDKFNETMEMGAAAGDTDAAWQVYANSLAESGDKALIDAIGEMAENGNLPEEFNKAWQRAMLETTDEGLQLDGLKAEVNGMEVDTASLSDSVQEALSNIEASGNTVQVSGSDIEVTLGEVAVNEGDALGKISEAVGMTVDQLKEYNGLASDAEVDVGMQIRIPMEQINVDTADLQSAVDQTVQEASSVEPAEVDTTANVTVTDAQTDASAAKASADAEVDEAFSETHETQGSANVTLEQTNNSAEVYSQVGSDLQGAMSAGYSVSTNASIHVNYSIANPTASISFSGGGSGSATVSASLNAAGGAVGLNGPELSWVGEEGLEYIIPTVPSRRGRGIALWEQAGQKLGVLDGSGEIAAHANGGIVGPSGEVMARDTVIPLAPENDYEDNQPIWSVTGQQLGGGTSEDSTDSGTRSETVNAAPQGQQAGNSIEVKVDMNPVIKIEGDGMDEQKIFDVMLSRCREMADELGDEIAERMSKIFENMPLIQEA